jgi:predicted MFS family arabinose efflux permease
VSELAHPPLRRNRNFMMLWSGQATSSLGNQVAQVAYPLLVLALTHSAAKAGLVGFARNLPAMLFALPVGALADRVDRKLLMATAAVASAVALALIPLALAAGHLAFGLIVTVAFIDGTGFVTIYITERGVVRRLVAPEQLGEAVARNESRSFAAMVGGPPLGGLLFALGRAVPFAANAVSYAVCAVTTLTIDAPFQDARAPTHSPGDVRDGLRWIWRRPLFRFTGLLFAGSNPIFTGLYLLVVVLARDHGASSALIGAMLAIGAAGGLAGALLAPRLQKRLTARWSVLGESWAMVVALPWLLLAHNALLLGVIVAAAEMITPVTNSILVGLRISLTPDELQGRVQAGSTLISLSAGWAGPLAVGLLLQNAGSTATILVLCGWATALAVLATLSPSLRHIPVAELPATG